MSSNSILLDIGFGDIIRTDNNLIGKIEFIGLINNNSFKIGLILNKKKGNNNGFYKKIKYFETKNNYGLFIKHKNINEIIKKNSLLNLNYNNKLNLIKWNITNPANS